MRHSLRALIVAGLVGFGGLAGVGSSGAKAQGFGPYPGRGFSLSLGVGQPYGYGSYGGYPGYGSAQYGYGYGGSGLPAYGPGYGYGYGPGGYSRYSETIVTRTTVYCDRCGAYVPRGHHCGGGGHGQHGFFGGGYGPGYGNYGMGSRFPW